MTRYSPYVLLLILLGHDNAVLAAPYPVVTSIQTTITSATTAYYHVELGVVDVPGTDTPAPLGWAVGLAHRHDNFPGGEDTAVLYFREGCSGGLYCTTVAVAGDTMSTAALRAYYKGTTEGSINHIGKGNGGECVGYVATPQQKAPWSAVIFPPGSCVYAPPGREWCSIVEPTIELDHGTIRLSDGAVDRTVAGVTVNCTAPMTVRLAFGEDVLTLSSGVTSRLATQFQGGSEWVHMNAGDNAGSIMSDLRLNGAAAGSYAASTIMYVLYQ